VLVVHSVSRNTVAHTVGHSYCAVKSLFFVRERSQSMRSLLTDYRSRTVSYGGTYANPNMGNVKDRDKSDNEVKSFRMYRMVIIIIVLAL